MLVSAIVAVAKHHIIGKDNDIPWYLPADLKYFKEKTLNHHIIMGRKCFDSIGKPLPKRTNIIVSRNPFLISSNCTIARSIEEALEVAYDNQETEAFIIGGGEIYRQSMDFLDKIYLTEVAVEVQGDITFPEIDSTIWKLISEVRHTKDEKNEWDYTFKVFERVTSYELGVL
jgi:dihydrofolate reductase